MSTDRRRPGAHLAVYRGPEGVFHPDTCAPLRAAASAGEIDFSGYGRDTYPGIPLGGLASWELRSVGSWRITREQDWGLDWHRNEGIEIGVVTAGDLRFSCEGQDFDLRHGDVTITRPWQVHRVGRPNVGISTYTWFIIDVGVRRPNQAWTWPAWMPYSNAERSRLTELLSHNERPVWRAGRELMVEIERLERLLRGDRRHPVAKISSCISDALLELSELIERQNPELDSRLSSAERTVQMFLRALPGEVGRPWTVRSMATACGLGSTRFTEYCRQLVNRAPMQYLAAVRVTAASERLATSDDTVLQIAVDCGFGSSQYFSTVFRRATGVTPRDFRSRHRATRPVDGQREPPATGFVEGAAASVIL